MTEGTPIQSDPRLLEILRGVADSTISTRTYLERIIEDHDTLYDARFRAGEIAISTAMAAQKDALSKALESSDRAVSKAEIATEKRFESVNEFRETLSDLQQTYMSRIEATGLLKALDDKLATMQATFDGKLDRLRIDIERSATLNDTEIAGLREYRSAQVGARTLARDTWGYVVGGIGMLIGIAGFIAALVFHFVK